MNRKEFLALSASGVLAGGLNRALQAAPNTAAPAKDATNDKAIQPATLAVSIAVPAQNGNRYIIVSDDNPSFDAAFNVVIQNLSDEPQNIWQEWNSWGYYNVSLEITAVNGEALKETMVVRKGSRDWARNGATSETLSPKEAVVRAIHPSFPKSAADSQNVPKLIPPGWEGTYERFPLPVVKGQEQKVTMRAVFTIEADWGTRDQKVWTGRIQSATHEYTISRR